MPRIRGKFAPMFEELGNDPRWLLELNDFEKLIYQLVLCTIYWSNGTAPDDARFYQRRYNLNARPYQVRRALDAIKLHFRKLIAIDEKLTLLNYKGYGNGVDTLDKNMCRENKNKNKKENKSITEPPVPTAEPVVSSEKEFMHAWNSHHELPKIMSMTGTRSEKLRTRFKSPVFSVQWREAIERLSKSSFATGKTANREGKTWRASVDWLLDNDTNIVKILEGKYDDGVKQDSVDRFVQSLRR